MHSLCPVSRSRRTLFIAVAAGAVLTISSSVALLASQGEPPFVEELTFQSGDAILAGSLFLPPGEGPHPAVLLLHGSGPQTRGWPYREHAVDFARHGIATLVYDKRGAGESTGRPEGAVDFDQLASDAVAALDLLANRPEIDRRALGVMGRSQGAWVAPVVAGRSPEVDFLVLLVGGGVPVLEQNLYATRKALERQGRTEGEIRRVVEAQRALVRYFVTEEGYEEAKVAMDAIRNLPWFEQIPVEVIRRTTQVPPPSWVAQHRDDVLAPLAETRFDPTPFLERVDVPLLALLAGDDVLTPTWETARTLDRILSSGRSPMSSIVVFPGADHTLCRSVADRSVQPGCAFVPGFQEAMTSWIDSAVEWGRERAHLTPRSRDR